MGVARGRGGGAADGDADSLKLWWRTLRSFQSIT